MVQCTIYRVVPVLPRAVGGTLCERGLHLRTVRFENSGNSRRRQKKQQPLSHLLLLFLPELCLFTLDASPHDSSFFSSCRETLKCWPPFRVWHNTFDKIRTGYTKSAYSGGPELRRHSDKSRPPAFESLPAFTSVAVYYRNCLGRGKATSPTSTRPIADKRHQ